MTEFLSAASPMETVTASMLSISPLSQRTLDVKIPARPHFLLLFCIFYFPRTPRAVFAVQNCDEISLISTSA